MVASPKYGTYRHSGFDWLGEIPDDWQAIRAKYVFREIDERSRTGDEELLSVSHLTGVTPRSEKNVNMFLAEDYTGAKLCQPNDVVINTMWAWMGALGVSPIEGLVSPAYGVYRPNEKVFPKFLDSLLRTSQYIAEYIRRSTGIHSSRLRLYLNQFLDIPLLLPPLEQQKRIIEFLDPTTADIDRAIAQKQRLIELLQEQKAILINQAVTKGLNPNVPMCDSGIKWLGEIPEHWSLAKLKFISTHIGDGIHATPEYVGRSDYYFVNGNNLIQGKVCITESTRCVSEGELEKHKIELDIDTILISINGTIGNVAFYQGESIILGKSAAYIKGIKVEEIHKYFLGYFLKSSSARRYFFDEVTGSTIYNLSLGSLRNTSISIPPIKEQVKITSFLDDALNRVAEMEQNIQSSIITIQEWRNILIANAVTGKIKV